MDFPDKFQEIWSGGDQLPIVEPDPETPYCRYAQTLRAYSDDLVATVTKTKPTTERVMQAMLRLQRQYFRLRLQAPASCRKHLASAKHICLHPVYEDAYHKLEGILDIAEDRSLFAQPKRPAPPEAPEPKRPQSVAEVLAEALQKRS